MTNKGDNTRKKILDCALKLFAENGYSNVTMKDVCELSGLSRGGLYRHFSSTAEMISILMQEEQLSANVEVDKRIKENIDPLILLDGFINQHISYLLSPIGKLELAYAQFVQTDPQGKEVFKNRLDSACARAYEIILCGQAKHIFVEKDPKQLALHITIFIGGLRSQVALNALNEEQIRTQMIMLKNIILK